MRLGVLAGSVLPLSIEGFGDPEPNDHGTPSSGLLEVHSGSGLLLVIARHGAPPSIPPHLVDHRANIRALEISNVDAIVSVCSCGALRRDIPVPCFAVPDDIIDLHGAATFVTSEIRHITPDMDQGLMEMLYDSATGAGLQTIRGGTYVQTKGPRLETKAEIRLISQWGEFVGMNMAPEAFLSMEAGIPYAALLTVDNYANGLVEGRLDFRDIIAHARRSWDRLLEVLKPISDGQMPKAGRNL